MGRGGSAPPREVLPASALPARLQPLEQDLPGAVQSQAAAAFEEVGQGVRRAVDRGEEVEVGDQGLVEQQAAADDFAFGLDVEAVRLGVGAQAVERVAAGCRQRRRGEEGVLAQVEGQEGEIVVDGLAVAEQTVGAIEEWEDLPGAESVGLGGGARLVALGQQTKDLSGEDGEQLGHTLPPIRGDFWSPRGRARVRSKLTRAISGKRAGHTPASLGRVRQVGSTSGLRHLLSGGA
jgi:hypothetical protein